MKKAQITPFIIVGILIMLLIGAYLFIQSRMARDTTEMAETRLLEVPLEARPVYTFVDNCVKDVILPGIYLLGLQGGHIYTPGDAIASPYGEVRYGFTQGRSLLLSRPQLEAELSAYVGETLASCIAGFQPFKEQGMTIEAGTISVRTTIMQDTVRADITYPLTLTDPTGTTKIPEDYSIVVNVPLGKATDMAAAIVQRMAEDPEWVDLTMLASADAEIDALPLDERTLLYAINMPVAGQPDLIFMFAAGMPPTEYPRLIVAPRYDLAEDRPFTLQLAAQGGSGNISFEAYTALFTLNESGLIEFEPAIPGEYIVEIRAVDGKGHHDAKNVTFAIARRVP